MTLFFIGVGLSPVKNLTLESLDAIDRCEKIYVDTYTGYLDEEVLNFLRRRKGGQLVLASRKMLEDEGVKIVMEAMERDVGIVVAGDPFIATTHQALRSEAFLRKVPVCIVHGISVISAAASISGLHIYKFGRIATVPRTKDLKQLSQPYQAILDNLALGLHTLLLLDTADGGLTVQEALEKLRSFERDYTHKIFVDELLIIAAARIGLRDFRISAFRLDQIEHISLPSPPHCMIIPGEMHFTEREFVKTYSTDPHYLDF
ncbi:MAG: diphthine synthase, partial [Nitrososphaerota archaeon]